MNNVLGLSELDINLLIENQISISFLYSLTDVTICDPDGNLVVGQKACQFVANELIEEFKEEESDVEFLTDEAICHKHGHTIVCLSPLEIKLSNGDFVTKGFAKMYLNSLRHL